MTAAEFEPKSPMVQLMRLQCCVVRRNHVTSLNLSLLACTMGTVTIARLHQALELEC